MKPAKQRLIDAGYMWIRPVNTPKGSARRVLVCRATGRYWFINDCEHAEEIAKELLGADHD